MTAFDAELRSLVGPAALSRRAVVVTSLATGFALAVQPVAAQTTINTDTNGLQAGEIRVKTPTGEIPAYQAMPASGGPFPIVLVSRRSSACMSTSGTSVAVLPSWAIWRSPPSFMRGKAMSPRWPTFNR